MSFKSSRVAIIGGLFLTFVSVGGCDDPQERGRAHIERGLQLLEDGEYDKARVEFLNAARVSPGNGQTWYYLGTIYEQKDQWADAYDAFSRAVQEAPDHADALFRLGRLQVLIGAADDALAQAEKVIALNQGDSRGHALKASVYMRQKKYLEARKEAERALMLNPGDVNATVVLAEYFRTTDQIPQALAVLGEGISHNPSETSLRVMKAALHVERSEPEKAASELQSLIELEPQNENYRMGLANVYASTGRIEMAETILREGVELAPKDSGLKLKLVEFLELTRGVQPAENALKEFIAKTPEDFGLRFALEELYLRHDRREEAKKVLADIASLAAATPDGLKAKARLAQVHWRGGDKEAAKRLIAEIMDEAPSNGVALFTRAQIAFEEKAFDRAIADLRGLLRSDPQSIPALALLSTVYVESGREGLATDTLRQAIDLEPSNEAIRVTLVEMLRREGEQQRALQLVDRGLAHDPNSVLLLATKGEILLELRRHAEARPIIGTLNGIADARYQAHRLNATLSFLEERFQPAANEFAEARVLRPQATAPVVGQALSLAALGQTDKSIAVLSDFARESPPSAMIWTHLGDLYQRSDRTQDAVHAYRKALELAPENIDLYVKLSRVLEKQNLAGAFIEVIARGVEASPKNKELALVQGIVLEKAGRHMEAIAAYERLFAALGDEMRRTGDNALNIAVNNFAALIADYHSKDEKALRRALQMASPLQASSDPQSAYYLDTIGWLHYRLGAVSEALTFLKRAVASAPDHPIFRYHLGMAHSANGEVETAREQFEKVSAADTENPVLAQARKALASLPKQ